MPKKIVCTLDQYANIFRYCELNYKQYKKHIQKKNKRGLNQSLFSFRCKVCKNHRDASPLMRCHGCQDMYHLKCVDEESKHLCKSCQAQLQTQLLKLQYITQEVGDKLIVHECKQVNTVCCVCYKKCETEKKYCYRCNLNQHIECFNSDSEFCSVCEQYLKENLPQQFDTIPLYVSLWKSEYTQQDDLIIIEGTKKTNRVRLITPKYSDTKEKQFYESYSLIRVLCAKSVYFSDDLTYFPEDCKPEDNNAEIESKLESLDDDNLRTFLQFKEISRLGLTPQVMIDFHTKSGFIAKSTGFIKKNSILAEYSGEVKKWESIIFDQNDSIMELLPHPNPKKSLYVVPEKYSNIARFVCGIDNTINEQVLKLNVKCLRVAINRQARIIMYACKDVQPNEILYFDYNSGGKNQYPTEGFQIL